MMPWGQFTIWSDFRWFHWQYRWLLLNIRSNEWRTVCLRVKLQIQMSIIIRADSCVKPFEKKTKTKKNEQLHNAGVKKKNLHSVLQCREGCNIMNLIYRDCNNSPNNSRFLFMFCLHLVAEVCNKMDIVISLIRKAHILPDTSDIKLRVLMGNSKTPEWIGSTYENRVKWTVISTG